VFGIVAEGNTLNAQGSPRDTNGWWRACLTLGSCL